MLFFIHAFARPGAGQTLPKTATQKYLKPGIVIEHVWKGSDPAKAGLLKGDIILYWRQGDAGGPINSVWDMDAVQLERSSRAVRFDGLSHGKSQTWIFRFIPAHISYRPHFIGAALGSYLRAQQSSSRRDFLSAADSFAATEEYFAGHQYIPVSSWLEFHRAKSLIDAQRVQEAKEAFENALRTAEIGDSLVSVLLKTAWANLLMARDQLTEAARRYDEVLRESSLLPVGRLLDATVRARLGWIDVYRGDLTSANTNARNALDVFKQLAPQSFEHVNTLHELGFIQLLVGNLTGAASTFLQARNAMKKCGCESVLGTLNLIFLGQLAYSRGDLAQSERYLLSALASPGKERSTIQITLGLAARRMGRLRQSEMYYRAALAALPKVGIVTNQKYNILGNLGDVYLDRKDFAKAKEYYLEEFEIARKASPNGPDVVEVLDRLAEADRGLGNLQDAESYYRQGLELAEQVIPGTTRHAEILAGLALVMVGKGDLRSAAVLYEESLNALENQNTRLGGGVDARASFRAKHDYLYREYLELSLNLKQIEPAFEVLERSRAQTLLEMLTSTHIDIRRGADPQLLDRARSIESEIHSKSEHRIHLINQKSHGDAKAGEEIRALEEQIRDLTSANADIEGEIRASSPGFTALTQPRPLKAAEIQKQLLDDDTLLLEFSLGEERSHVFAVTPDSLQAFDLPKRAEIERMARRVYRLIAARNVSVRGETPAQAKQRSRLNQLAFSRAVAELSRIVLGPVAAQLGNKRLLIVPDGALAYVPFAVLPEPDTTTEPLVVKHEIVNLPSASVLAVLRQEEMKRQQAPKAVAVLADPVFDRNDPRVRRSLRPVSPTVVAARRPAMRGGSLEDDLSSSLSSGLLTRSAGDLGMTRNGRVALPRLPYSRQEADSILAVTPSGQGMEAVDFKANRATATDPSLSQYRIIHFATHGLLNSEHPELSGLVLSLVDEKGRPQDGFLDLEDIYNLDLPADLVVLSACETGLGKEISGEGLVGLTRGFMYAGASRVMASLWKVSDAATAHLMAEFYRGMEQEGMRPAAALRAAQVKMWQEKRWSSPYYWAAFQIQGEWK